jgi:hypothetical protein
MSKARERLESLHRVHMTTAGISVLITEDAIDSIIDLVLEDNTRITALESALPRVVEKLDRAIALTQKQIDATTALKEMCEQEVKREAASGRDGTVANCGDHVDCDNCINSDDCTVLPPAEDWEMLRRATAKDNNIRVYFYFGNPYLEVWKSRLTIPSKGDWEVVACGYPAILAKLTELLGGILR